jgi:hypothetical protein
LCIRGIEGEARMMSRTVEIWRNKRAHELERKAVFNFMARLPYSDDIWSTIHILNRIPSIINATSLKMPERSARTLA